MSASPVALVYLISGSPTLNRSAGKMARVSLARRSRIRTKVVHDTPRQIALCSDDGRPLIHSCMTNVYRKDNLNTVGVSEFPNSPFCDCIL